MNILFLCVANSARSQLAEGLAREIFKGQHVVESAGSVPAKSVNPLAVKALSEIGIDISNHFPKTWENLPSLFLENLDYVITLCAEEVCPTFLSKATKLHWGLPDPAAIKGSEEKKLRTFRNTRDEIQRRLQEFKARLK